MLVEMANIKNHNTCGGVYGLLHRRCKFLHLTQILLDVNRAYDGDDAPRYFSR